MDYTGKAVSFTHRVATGHPVAKMMAGGQRVLQPVPTELRTDDALVIAQEHVANGEPRFTLVYLAQHDNGVPSLETAFSIPFALHEDAKHERFWTPPAAWPALRVKASVGPAPGVLRVVASRGGKPAQPAAPALRVVAAKGPVTKPKAW